MDKKTITHSVLKESEEIEEFNNQPVEDFDENTDDFFFLEGDEVDDIIDDMHYEDHKKISSSEFFEMDEIEESEIDELLELKEELESATVYDIDEIKAVLYAFINALKFVAEFKDIVYSFNYLIKLLEDVDTWDERYEKVLVLLEELLNDIKNWINVMFVERNTVDIHYFDASFLANIAQIETMLQKAAKTPFSNNGNDFSKNFEKTVKLLESALKEVVIPFVNVLEKKFNLEKEKKINMILKFDTLLSAMILNEEAAEKIIKEIYDMHTERSIDENEFIKYLRKFFVLYNIYMNKKLGFSEENRRKLIKFENKVLKDLKKI